MNKMRWLIAAALGLAFVAAGVGAGIAATRDDDGGRASHDRQTQVETEDATENENEDGDEAEDRDEGEDVAIGDEDALTRASEAALAYLANQGLEGEVTDTEEGDEESYYEIEVTLSDGRQVDVQLDEQFAVVGLD